MKYKVTDFKIGEFYLCKSTTPNDIWIAKIVNLYPDENKVMLSDVVQLTSPYFEQEYKVDLTELHKENDNVKIVEQVSSETHPEYWL